MSEIRFDLQEDLEVSLEKLVRSSGKTKAELMNKALKELVQRMAVSEQRWQETLPAIESAKEGRTVSAQETFEWLRSCGTDNELPTPEIK